MPTRAGRFVTQQAGRTGFKAFIPAPLPPAPGIAYTAQLTSALQAASLALGRLDGASQLIRDPELFLYTYIRKEAVLSSQIEGTQSTLADLLLFEHEAVPGVPGTDADAVANYIAAMQHGLARIREGFPLSLRLLREIHGILVSGSRGASAAPGAFRTSQNWIGGTRPGDAMFVPPPPHEVPAALDDLERYLHATDDGTPLVVRAGVAHAQFETIHPFLDGNGRVGRLLITLLLCGSGELSQPLLYLSLYLKKHKEQYYQALQRIRTHGDWEGWLDFYLRGIAEVATLATRTAKRIIALFEEDRARVVEQRRGVRSTLAAYEALQRTVITSAAAVMRQTRVSFPTAQSALRRLQGSGIAVELQGVTRERTYVYQRYLDALRADEA
jgi:Fic family protein